MTNANLPKSPDTDCCYCAMKRREAPLINAAAEMLETLRSIEVYATLSTAIYSNMVPAEHTTFMAKLHALIRKAEGKA